MYQRKWIDILVVGDQIKIPLGDLGTFTATVQKFKDDSLLFLFDDYITKLPMNENGSNKGGYEKSDLKKWIENDLFKMFPKELREHMIDITIPTVGEICGWKDSCVKECVEPDNNEQLLLMKWRSNRIAYCKDEWGWLRNSVKNEFSSSLFAFVDYDGYISFSTALSSRGVRPEFWLVR